MRERDWHSTQNEDYLALQLRRLEEPPLIWCKQFFSLVLNDCKKAGLECAEVNDIGCSVGHFLRVLDNSCIDFSYNGYDLSDIYLSVARDAFQGISRARFTALDISKTIPCDADYTVCSATIEHIDNYKKALANILKSTKRMFVLRTFLGPEKYEICKKEGAEYGYLIRQIDQSVIEECALSHGFTVEYMKDSATRSMPKLVCESSSIQRVQSVLIFSRIESEDTD